MERERTFLQVDFVNPFFEEFRAESFSLFAELHHQLGPLDPFGKPGIVLDVGRNHELTAGCSLSLGICGRINQQWVKVRAGRINCRGQTGRTRANNYNLSVNFFCSQEGFSLLVVSEPDGFIQVTANLRLG